MVSSQPELVGRNGRRFAGFATAVAAFIVDPASGRFLLLSSPPKRPRPGWEIVNGGVEAGETLLDALRREVAEEAGPGVHVDVLGTVHAWSFRYDDAIPHLMMTAFVAAYLGGDITPSQEMTGCEHRWATLDEVGELATTGGLFPQQPWVFERARQCFDLWFPMSATRELPGWETGFDGTA